MPRLLPFALALLLSACASTGIRPHTAASEVRDIQDLGVIASALAESPKRTLLVLDIDDTLLTSDHFFGSDKWYDWQKTLPAGDPGKVPCLFDVISLNYETGTQRPTQPNAAQLVNALNVDKLMLTSRNPLYRGGTQRTLHDNGFTLPAMLGPSADGRSFDLRKSPDAAPVRVVYDNGIFMTTGQDKGKALLSLLQRLKLHYDRVLLVDDGERNITHMRDALQAAEIDYLGLHYTRISKQISEEDAASGRSGWQAWRALLATNYPERLQAFERGQCSY